MHNSHTSPGIGNPFRLIPPGANRHGNGNSGAVVEGREEEAGRRKRVLLVEDEFLLSAVLAADLQDAGYDVLGPFSTLAGALDAARTESFDGAILDINLKGELVYPLAEKLRRRGTPFLFLSGYDTINMPESFRGHARLAKPAEPANLLRAVQAMLRPGH